MGIKFDLTINLGNLITLGGGIIAFVIMWQKSLIIQGQLVKRVDKLDHDMYDQSGLVPEDRHRLTQIIMMLVGRGHLTADEVKRG